MTVRELIEALQASDQNAEVHMTYNYGDHWRTMVAPTIESVEGGAVRHSDYHDMDKVVDDDDEKYDEATQVVLLHS